MNDAPQVVAAVTLLQLTTVWIALRVIGAFWFCRKRQPEDERRQLALTSTGNLLLDRYLFYSCITICGLTALVISMLITQEISSWATLPIFGILVGLDVTSICSVASQAQASNATNQQDIFSRFE